MSILNKESIIKTIKDYLKDVFTGTQTVFEACKATIPYFFRWGDAYKEVTEGYPDPISSKTADDLPPRSRGLLFNDIEKCTGCGDCAKACPAKCIYISSEPGSDLSKTWVSVFDIDISQCIFCGLCTDVCQPSSLVHTRQYEGAAYQLENLMASFGRGQVTQEQKEKWALVRQMIENDEVSV